MTGIFRACVVWALLTWPLQAVSQTRTGLDEFSTVSARRGVLLLLSGRLHTLAGEPATRATVDFQIKHGSGWRSILDDFTWTSNVTDAAGRASVAFIPPDDLPPGEYAIRAV